jgi:gamma-glutamyltranspeptidase/glutathione hydrolase
MRDFGLNVQQAVNAPRVHQQWLPDRIELEPGRFSPDTIRLLEHSGNTVTPEEIMGDSEAIEVDAATGERLGASDVRNESGKAVGY